LYLRGDAEGSFLKRLLREEAIKRRKGAPEEARETANGRGPRSGIP